MFELVAQAGGGGFQQPIWHLIDVIKDVRINVLYTAPLFWLRWVTWILVAGIAMTQFVIQNHSRRYPSSETLRFLSVMLFVAFFFQPEVWLLTTSRALMVANGFGAGLFQALTNANFDQSQISMAYFRMIAHTDFVLPEEFSSFLPLFFGIGPGHADLLFFAIGYVLLLITLAILTAFAYIFHGWVAYGYALLSSIGIFFLPFVLLKSTAPMFYAWLRLYIGTLLVWPMILFSMVFGLVAISAMLGTNFLPYLYDQSSYPTVTVEINGFVTVLPVLGMALLALIFVIVSWKWAYQLAGAGSGAVQASFGRGTGVM